MKDHEKEAMKAAGDASHVMLDKVNEELGLPPEMISMIVGNGLAVFDALIAIRDGSEWRGETDPKAIAHKALAPLMPSNESPA